MTIKRFAMVIFLISGCSDGPKALLTKAEEALGKGAHTEAIAAAEKGLAAKPAEATLRWRLELVRLEALARAGKADDAATAIERLAGAKNTQIKASHYLSTADQLRTAGEKAGAIQLLDRGKKRYPDDAAIAKAITQAKEKGTDEELDELRSLGYLD